MNKVLKLSFGNSKEEIMLYNWLITHENTEELAKSILVKEMNKDLKKNTNFDENTMASIDDDMFDADFFRV